VNGDQRLACRVEVLDGEPDSLDLKRHAYEAPYNRDRTGQLLTEQHEPYVELIQKRRSCRILSLFGDGGRDRKVFWVKSANSWELATDTGGVEVDCSEDTLQIRCRESRWELSVDLA
jgi:hypothetical protein